MATSKQAGSATARNTSAPQRPAVYFPNGNYVLTQVFSSKESMELAKERLRKRQEERNFGFR
ncbi:hypothetical protein H6A33_10395 [Collinsella tanakaei]|nr:hypothetical protein [Collinsella tanakaei]